MVKNPFIILLELFIGLAQQAWDTVTFSISKLWEFLQSLAYYSSHNLPLTILSGIFAMIVTYFVLKYIFHQIPFKLILVVLGIIVITLITLILVGTFTM